MIGIQPWYNWKRGSILGHSPDGWPLTPQPACSLLKSEKVKDHNLSRIQVRKDLCSAKEHGRDKKLISLAEFSFQRN